MPARARARRDGERRSTIRTTPGLKPPAGSTPKSLGYLRGQCRAISHSVSGQVALMIPSGSAAHSLPTAGWAVRPSSQRDCASNRSRDNDQGAGGPNCEEPPPRRANGTASRNDRPARISQIRTYGNGSEDAPSSSRTTSSFNCGPVSARSSWLNSGPGAEPVVLTGSAAVGKA